MPDLPDPPERPDTRPLEAHITPHAGGWNIRLPLRRETVRVEKRVVVAEEVAIRRRTETQTRQVQATTRRERLRVDTFGETEPPDITVRPARRRA
jgi:uncharacterized protein (TIGR02271 family)